jgi:hypothetical protein
VEEKRNYLLAVQTWIRFAQELKSSMLMLRARRKKER